MSSPLRVALVGIGGYGNNYVAALLNAPDPSRFRIVGAVDPKPNLCKHQDQLLARGVPLFSSLDDFHHAAAADVTIICSPLHLHAQHTCAALRHGSHVLCEKPLCVTPEEIAEMARAERLSGKKVAIGYQWSFSAAVQHLKRDVLSGRYGKPRRLRTLVLWPRDESYYSRNSWAGRISDPAGRPILDSPVNNACAHHLHNMLYVLGSSIDGSAEPISLRAELFRAFAIQNYDTAAVSITTSDGVQLLLLASHAVEHRHGPVFTFEFENGIVEYADGPEATIVGRFLDGSIQDYGSPDADRMRKLWCTLDALQSNGPLPCGIAASAAQTRCAWAVQHSEPGILQLPAEMIRIVGPPSQRQIIVRDLDRVLNDCYLRWKLPSTLGVRWAQPGKAVPVGKEMSLV